MVKVAAWHPLGGGVAYEPILEVVGGGTPPPSRPWPMLRGGPRATPFPISFLFYFIIF
jgi:hypothetical protein